MSEVSPAGTTFNNSSIDFGNIKILTFVIAKNTLSSNFGKKRGRGSLGKKGTKKKENVVDRVDNYFSCECSLCKG